MTSVAGIDLPLYWLLRPPLTAGQVGLMACHRPAALICRQHRAKAPPSACDGRPAQCGRAGSGWQVLLMLARDAECPQGDQTVQVGL